MKKKIFGGIAVLAFAAIVGLNVKMNTDKNQISDLAMANVEALAGETTIGIPPCRWNGLWKDCLRFSYGAVCIGVGSHCEPLIVVTP